MTLEGVGQMAQGLGGPGEFLQAGAQILLQGRVRDQQLAGVGDGGPGLDHGVAHIAIGQAVDALDQGFRLVDGAPQANDGLAGILTNLIEGQPVKLVDDAQQAGGCLPFSEAPRRGHRCGAIQT